jgi:hypothetical protein
MSPELDDASASGMDLWPAPEVDPNAGRKTSWRANAFQAACAISQAAC